MDARTLQILDGLVRDGFITSYKVTDEEGMVVEGKPVVADPPVRVVDPGSM